MSIDRHLLRPVTNIEETKILREKGVVVIDERMGVSQLLGGTCPGCPLTQSTRMPIDLSVSEFVGPQHFVLDDSSQRDLEH